MSFHNTPNRPGHPGVRPRARMGGWRFFDEWMPWWMGDAPRCFIRHPFCGASFVLQYGFELSCCIEKVFGNAMGLPSSFVMFLYLSLDVSCLIDWGDTSENISSHSCFNFEKSLHIFHGHQPNSRVGDGYQPNSRGLFIHYKDFLLKVGWPSSFKAFWEFNVSWAKNLKSLEAPVIHGKNISPHLANDVEWLKMGHGHDKNQQSEPFN